MKAYQKEIVAPSQAYKFTYYLKVAVIAILLSLLLLVFLVKVTSLFQCRCKTDLDDQDSMTISLVNATLGPETKEENSLRLVSRDEWLAEPTRGPVDKLILPVHRVVILHTTTESCASQATCKLRVRIIQTFHIKSRQFSDIAYNFLIGGDGNVYEGRGWDQQGAHTKGYNVDSIGIAFIGLFQTITPSEEQLNAAKLIIEEGVRLNKLVKDYRLYGARQLSMLDGTGSALYKQITKWPNWSATV